MPAPDPREIAERAIASAVEDIDYGGVGDLMGTELYDELGEAAYDALHREAHDQLDKAVVTVTWPGDVQSPTLPNLVALTETDTNWTWDVCIVCGSADVTHRALWIRTHPDGVWAVTRSAWCADQGCQGDRGRSVNLIYVAADGLTRASTEWEGK